MPRLLDLFCGAGGCAMGYRRAGFDVVGVDNRPQPRYPFEFVLSNALTALRHLLNGGNIRVLPLDDAAPVYSLGDFDAIHASPPCQKYSQTQTIHRGRPSEKKHPDLIGPVRDLLRLTGKPWVIENVPRAPLETPMVLCGSFFGLRVKRHRLFESNVMLMAPARGCYHPPRGSFIQAGRPIKEGDWVIVAGHISGLKLAGKAMGIDWMTRNELVQAIPPAYTEFVGRQLMQVVMR